MSNIRLPKLTFWRTVVAVIFLAGAYAAYARFALGFQRSTNLVDSQPWGCGSVSEHSVESESPPEDSPSQPRSIFWASNATALSFGRPCCSRSLAILRS
jgi:hypothetical protein